MNNRSLGLGGVCLCTYGQNFWDAVTLETGDLRKGALRVLVYTFAGNHRFFLPPKCVNFLYWESHLAALET